MYISAQKLDAYLNRIYALARQYLTTDEETVAASVIDQMRGLLQAGGDLGILDLSNGVERVIYILGYTREDVMKDWNEGPKKFNDHFHFWRLIIDDAVTEEVEKALNDGE